MSQTINASDIVRYEEDGRLYVVWSCDKHFCIVRKGVFDSYDPEDPESKIPEDAMVSFVKREKLILVSKAE